MSDKSPIKPLGDRVIVRPLTDEEAGAVSASGIIIPDTAKKEKPEQGIVIAVDNDRALVGKIFDQAFACHLGGETDGIRLFV